MMSSIPLSLSKKKKKKSNLYILHVTFCKYIYIFLNLKNRNGHPNNYFCFWYFENCSEKREPNT